MMVVLPRPLRLLVLPLLINLLCWSLVDGFSPQRQTSIPLHNTLRQPCRPVSIRPHTNARKTTIHTSATTCLRAVPLDVVPATTSLLLRGGAKVALDLGRESYKLQSMAQYSTITALMMNACLRLYTSTRFPKNEEGTTKWIEHLFVALTSTCIISGAYTAVLFNILGIYSKESLGIRNHCGYVAFQTATAIYRKWGFRSFLTTCGSFVGSFLVSVYHKAEAGTTADAKIKSRGLWIFSISVIMMLLAVVEIQKILALATRIIYTPEACAKNNIALAAAAATTVTRTAVTAGGQIREWFC